MNKHSSTPLWKDPSNKSVGAIATEFAAREDISLDQQLVAYECDVNEAHVIMLHQEELVTTKIARMLISGLEEIKQLNEKGKFILSVQLEDVHSNVEQYFINKYGIGVGGYLRLGIARNDQIYTDTRMWMKNQIIEICILLTGIVDVILSKAKKHVKTVMPGYTHLRISQPITFGHWLVAKAYHCVDDLNNLIHTYSIVDFCPLGIFEMAGTHLHIDRNLTAKLLGFNGITPNSLYTANQRGEIEAKLISDLCLLALHIRRTMGEIILFSTDEFGLLSFGDEYSTGGTAQPNLKNPDGLEILRANMAHMISGLVEILLIMDPLPSGFSRDTQRTKLVLMNTVKTMRDGLPLAKGIFASLIPNAKRMEDVASMNFSTAPDLSLQISVKCNLSYREAYKVVKTLIKIKGQFKNFDNLTVQDVKKAALQVLGKDVSLFQSDIDTVSTSKMSALSHHSKGGSAPAEVKNQIEECKKKLIKIKIGINKNQNELASAGKILHQAVNKILAMDS